MFDPGSLVRRQIVASAKGFYAGYKAKREELKHEAMIEASKAKLAETTLVPGYTKIYA
jgi:hypothetical protein